MFAQCMYTYSKGIKIHSCMYIYVYICFNYDCFIWHVLFLSNTELQDKRATKTCELLLRI